MPKISVVIISYNRAKYLPEAIESVLIQTFQDWELLIIDDASTDNTKEAVDRYLTQDARIKYYRNETNLKISRSRNRGLDLAAGKYVAVLDSDDIWCDREKLSKQYDFLEANPDHTLVGGGVIVVDKEGVEIKRYLNPVGNDELRRTVLIKNPFAHSSVMYNREAVLQAGRYDNSLDGIEDYDLWLRLGCRAKFANIGSYLVRYRVHGGNISYIDRLRLMENNLALVKKYKKTFPSYYRAIIRRKARLLAYKMLMKIKQ